MREHRWHLWQLPLQVLHTVAPAQLRSRYSYSKGI